MNFYLYIETIYYGGQEIGLYLVTDFHINNLNHFYIR